MTDSGDDWRASRAKHAADCSVKELLDDWDEEATRLDAVAHRYRYENEQPFEAAKAEQLRECIAELGAVFPDAKLWHKEGVVPAEAFDEPEPPPTELDPKLAAGAREAAARLKPMLPDSVRVIVVVVRGTRYERGNAGVAWDKSIENVAECFEGCASMARARARGEKP